MLPVLQSGPRLATRRACCPRGLAQGRPCELPPREARAEGLREAVSALGTRHAAPWGSWHGAPRSTLRHGAPWGSFVGTRHRAREALPTPRTQPRMSARQARRASPRAWRSACRAMRHAPRPTPAPPVIPRPTAAAARTQSARNPSATHLPPLHATRVGPADARQAGSDLRGRVPRPGSCVDTSWCVCGSRRLVPHRVRAAVGPRPWVSLSMWAGGTAVRACGAGVG